MRRRVLAIIMSVMVMVAFMPTMSFAGDTELPTVNPSQAAVNHTHKGIVKDTVLVGNDCEGTIVKHECSCGETWVTYEEGTADHKVTTDTMSVEDAYALFEEEVDETLNEFIERTANLSIPEAKEQIPEFIDELNKLLLGVEFEDEVINKELVQDVTGTIASILRDAMENGELGESSWYAIGTAVKNVIYRYFIDVEYNLGQYLAGELNAYEASKDPYCYALVSTCKVCGTVTAVRFVKHEGEPKADCATTFVCDECGKTVRFADVSHFTSDVAKIAKQAGLVAGQLDAYEAGNKAYRDAMNDVTVKQSAFDTAKQSLNGLVYGEGIDNFRNNKHHSTGHTIRISGKYYNPSSEIVQQYSNALNSLNSAKSELSNAKEEFEATKGSFDENMRLLVNYMYFFDNAGKHDFETTVEEKACGKIVTVACKKCDEEFSFVVPTSILKHDYEWVTVNEAVCASTEENPTGINGLKVKKCKECGAIDLTSFTPVAPKHNFVDQVVEPTCSTYGYTVQRCADCGKYIPGTIKNFVKPLGHDYNIEMVVEPTCGNDGLLKIECKNGCHETMYVVGDKIYVGDELVTTKVEQYSEFVERIIPIRVVEVENIKDINGVKNAISKLADTPIVKLHDKLHDDYLYYFVGFERELLLSPIKLDYPDGGKHNFDTWGKIEATCLHGTQWVRKCSDCGYVDVHATGDDFIENDDALAHDITSTVGKKPTCGEYGYHYNYCSLCGIYYGDDMKTPLGTTKKGGKVFDDPIKDLGVECTPADKWTTTVEATCTEAGTRVKYCTECGAICATDDIECKHHDPADEWTTLVKSTFTKAGTRVKYCNTCGEICDSDDIAMLKLGKAYQPKLSSPAKGKLKIKIKKANKYATGYQIAYKKAGGTYKFIKVNGKTPSKTITKLAKGKKYTVKVRPYRVEGKKTFYGEYSTIKTFKIK